MTLNELLPSLHALPRADKLRLKEGFAKLAESRGYRHIGGTILLLPDAP